VKRALNLQDNVVDLEEQRKNNFYHVQNKGFGDVYLTWNNDVVL
jgi:hypothetical protein